MTAPTVLVNTYIRVNTKPKVDRVSKIFIICELPFGIVRLLLLGNFYPIITILLGIIYSLLVAGFLVHYLLTNAEPFIIDIAVGSSLAQSFFFIIFNLISIKRLQRYYTELNVFDRAVGCTPKIGKGTIHNIIYTVVMIVYITATFTLPYIVDSLTKLDLELIPVTACHIFEVHFNGHLLSLLIPRLRLINYYMEVSLSSAKINRTTSAEEFGFGSGTGNKALCKMEKLMNLYHTVIKAYDYLIEATKWQLLVTIIASFVSILCYGYHVSNTLIKSEGTITSTASCLALSAGIMLPLFAPCTLGDQVHNEVRRLRELLASRLYENQLDKEDVLNISYLISTISGLGCALIHQPLDKSSRGMARALLAWTETRDLSFSLLRMLNIDISLPFKFVGLLVTYLIILLQFQKVINP